MNIIDFIKISERVKRDFSKSLFDSDCDCTFTQLLIMHSIKNGNTSAAVISKYTGVDKMTISNVLKRLINKGFVNRRRSLEDSRRYDLFLGDNASQICDKAMAIMKNFEPNFSFKEKEIINYYGK